MKLKAGERQMLDHVLKHLELFEARTSMYVPGVNVATVQSYLHGLQAGCALGGLVVSMDLYLQVAATRGWRSANIVRYMQSKGLDDAAIIRELIALQAEVFRLSAQSKT
jgi:hypothetical protein